MDWGNLAAVGGLVLGALGLLRAYLADRTAKRLESQKAAAAERGAKSADAGTVIDGLGELAEELRAELKRERTRCSHEIEQAIKAEREECEAKIIAEANKLAERLDKVEAKQTRHERAIIANGGGKVGKTTGAAGA